MAIRRNLGGRYVETRERNTSKGHRGTIMGNWSSKTKVKHKSIHFFSWLLTFLIFLILVLFIYRYFFN
jgi:hypothetical protein